MVSPRNDQPSMVRLPDGGSLHVLEAGESDQGERLDRFFASRLAEMSRSRLKTLIKSGHAALAGKTIEEPNRRVKPGERYELRIPAPIEAVPRPENIPLEVVFEDEHLIVINKPAGLVVHPAAGHWRGTLVNALLHHCGKSLSGVGGVRRPGIVHRLDKDTSGLLVVAKHDSAHHHLAAQFADHGRSGPLRRAYLALVWGQPSLPAGTIDAPLARSAHNRQKMAVVSEDDPRGKQAITHYRLERSFGLDEKGRGDEGGEGGGMVSLLRCQLETGRTHQIRVHMAHLRHPLLGDNVYGAGFAASARNLPRAAQEALKKLNRQALHATELGFTHPVSGRQMDLHSPPPDDMQALMEALQQAGGA